MKNLLAKENVVCHADQLFGVRPVMKHVNPQMMRPPARVGFRPNRSITKMANSIDGGSIILTVDINYQ